MQEGHLHSTQRTRGTETRSQSTTETLRTLRTLRVIFTRAVSRRLVVESSRWGEASRRAANPAPKISHGAAENAEPQRPPWVRCSLKRRVSAEHRGNRVAFGEGVGLGSPHPRAASASRGTKRGVVGRKNGGWGHGLMKNQNVWRPRRASAEMRKSKNPHPRTTGASSPE